VLDLDDNCPLTANPDQSDVDEDEVGNVCDSCPGAPPGVAVNSDGCPLPIPGDFDRGDDVDQQDFGHTQSCPGNPGVPPPSGLDCERADLDVDDEDVSLLQNRMTGANIPADPACAD
jgi:hypothetical protein